MTGLPSKPVLGTEIKKSGLPTKPNVPAVKSFEDVIKESNNKASTSPVANDYSSDIEEREASSSDSIHIEELLRRVVEAKASDLHLSAGNKPLMRVRGEMEPISGYTQLSASECHRIMSEIMQPFQKEEFENHNELNMAFTIEGLGRFRVNVFKQRETTAAVVRLINDKLVPLEDLGMPAVMNDFAYLSKGLVLVTGPTGSGKSTTLAAIIDKINETRKCHILTIEDPVEYIHKSKKALINQREVGDDTESFSTALKNALRQDPDVILLGEMRDLETIQAALTAAETGHLVFATLHTQSAMDTVSRIVDVFPEGSKNAVRSQLSNTLQAIACQTLIRSLDGSKLIPAVEILKANGAIRSLIRKGQDEQVRTMMETNKGLGMQTMDSHLLDLVKNNEIAVEDGVMRSSNADTFIASLGGEAGINKMKRSQERMGGVK
jgi:twitching motility protein PilT